MINQWCWEDWVTFNLLLSSLWLITQGWNTLTARIQSMLLLEIAKEITAVCPEVYNSLQYNYNNSHEFLNKVEWLFPFLEVQHKGYLSLLHFEYWIANKGKCSAFNFLFFFFPIRQALTRHLFEISLEQVAGVVMAVWCTYWLKVFSYHMQLRLCQPNRTGQIQSRLFIQLVFVA